MAAALYTRLDPVKQLLLSRYAAASGLSMTDVVISLIDQLLYQVSDEYEPEPWIVDAVASGELPIRRCRPQGERLSAVPKNAEEKPVSAVRWPRGA